MKNWLEFSTGRWTGTYCVLSLDNAIVEKCLDPRLELGTQTLVPAGKHPVYFMLGRQSDVSSGAPWWNYFAMSYDEGIALVPNVQFKGTTGQFLYMPRLYLNSMWATLLGVSVFAYAKVLKDVVSAPNKFEVHDVEGMGNPLWAARVDPDSKFSEKDLAEGYEKMMSVFEQPLVGFCDSLPYPVAVVSSMSFTNHIRIPATVKLSIKDSSLASGILSAEYSLSPLGKKIANRAVHLVSDWTLSYPRPVPMA